MDMVREYNYSFTSNTYNPMDFEFSGLIFMVGIQSVDSIIYYSYISTTKL